MRRQAYFLLIIHPDFRGVIHFRRMSNTPLAQVSSSFFHYSEEKSQFHLVHPHSFLPEDLYTMTWKSSRFIQESVQDIIVKICVPG